MQFCCRVLSRRMVKMFSYGESKFKPVTHVIFDVDGLIFDTERLYTNIIQAICEPYNKKFTWDIKKKQMGRKQHEAGRILIEELGLPITVDEYCKKMAELQKEIFPANTVLLPGAEKLIRHLHKHKIPIAVASGSHAEEMELKLTKHKELFSLFHHMVCSSSDPEVKHGKPAPDCFLVAAKRFPDSPSPDKVLVFEDAVNGVEGALAAGMQVVWVPDANVDKSILAEKATLTLDTLEHFKPELFGLPPYNDHS